MIQIQDLLSYCPYCFAALGEGSGPCPVCGRDAALSPPPDALPLYTVLAGHLIAGAVVGRDASSFYYAAYDVDRAATVWLREYFPLAAGAKRGEDLCISGGEGFAPPQGDGFLENGTAYAQGEVGALF